MNSLECLVAAALIFLIVLLGRGPGHRLASSKVLRRRGESLHT